MADAPKLRILFWNTWLLRPRIWPGGPTFPGTDHRFAPDVAERARLVGQAIAGRFDVCCLAECFEQPEQDAVEAGFVDPQVASGPKRVFPRWTGSGLMTVVDPGTPARAQIEATATHRFKSGGDLRDADTFATKGALLTRVRFGDSGRSGLDVVSTHLFAGGDFVKIVGWDDHIRHHGVRLGQVDELVGFIQQARDPSLPLVLVGDFNIRYHDTRPGFGDPRASYRDLSARLEPLGLHDVWLAHGVGPGHTCTFEDRSEIPPATDDSDAVRDDAGPEPDGAASERIDYAWIAGPAGGSRSSPGSGGSDAPPLVTGVRRWAFPGRNATGGPAGSLSDHLGLSIDLELPTLRP